MALCFLHFMLIALLVASCAPSASVSVIENMITPLVPTPVPAPTSERPEYAPGELVDYIAQNGDTLPALAARFNTTVDEIMAANPIIPLEATTMPPGFPMKIPIYYLPLWGTAYQSIPDHAFVNGPAQIGFSTTAFVSSTTGWLKNYRVYAGERMRTGAEAVDYIAQNYSVSPQLLLALLEYQSGALTQPAAPTGKYMLGFRRVNYEGPYLQLIVAANMLNNGYYSWRDGQLTELELLDGTIFRPDPWQNAGSVSLNIISPGSSQEINTTHPSDPRVWRESIKHFSETRGLTLSSSCPEVSSSLHCNFRSLQVTCGHTPEDRIPAGVRASHFPPSILPLLLMSQAVIWLNQTSTQQLWQTG